MTDITPLIEENATRKKVLGAIDQMIAHVQKDDLAIITFAGHGAREQWGKVRPAGTELRGLHEVFLLRGMLMPDVDGKIDPSVPGSAGERILGAEMGVRLKRLDDLGARTIFVADSCFGAACRANRYSMSCIRSGSFPNLHFLPMVPIRCSPKSRRCLLRLTSTRKPDRCPSLRPSAGISPRLRSRTEGLE
ncbi:hypothetical protein [Bradyrhizobium cenepequi]